MLQSPLAPGRSGCDGLGSAAEEHAILLAGADLGGQTAVLPDGCRFGILHWGRNHWPRVGRLGAAPWDGIGEPLVPRCWEKHHGVAELLQAAWLHPAGGFEGKDCAFASAGFQTRGWLAVGEAAGVVPR